MQKLAISKAADYLEVSIDTLRRWDKKGKLSARKTVGGHRYYMLEDLQLFKHSLIDIAKKWVLNGPTEPEAAFYCNTSDVFKGRLSKLQNGLEKLGMSIDTSSLLVAIVGEIGNNSFDHNIGNWPDVIGIFFAYDLQKKHIVLADRGQGILKTLSRVKADIPNNGEALKIAFTKVLSARAPENRGNGLKFVLQVVLSNPFELEFLSGDATASVAKDNKPLKIAESAVYYNGCLAFIKY